ncbi:MAG TPA: DMT family transporter [Desulfovibrio sp.]|jgi:drug/metabolite transporter (DMT)-like permease|uniref:DMT family transporter n=1 Tax=Desulfovibrio TaxID=872 RepID=UPI0003FD28BD|nr:MULTISPECIES: DMT family transporter [Desulfovibrio]MDY0305198.1 DMT family transporter [Desulfovibrionaceae bacterium]HMM38660.1 DMT family transporter [Desulfovibrio sp.]
MNRSAVANILLLITALIWGCAFVAQRLGMEHMGPFTFNGVRFALGSLALAPLFLRLERGESGRTLRRPPLGMVRGGLLLGLVLFAGATLQQQGIIHTTAGKAGFITGMYVVLVPLLGRFLGQRIGLGTWIGAGLALAGLYFLSVGESLSVNFGDVLIFIGAFFWAGHVLLIGWLTPGMTAGQAVRLSSIQFAVCAVLSLGVALAGEEITLAGLRGGLWPILYGGFMSVGVAYTLQVVAQRDAKPAHAAIILNLETVFAALAGVLLLGEGMDLRGVLGCGLMLSGMLVSQFKP